MSRVGVLSRKLSDIHLSLSFVAFSFGRRRYFLAHVAFRNLPWQGLHNGIGMILMGNETAAFTLSN